MTPVQIALAVLLAPLASAAVIALFLRRQGTLAAAVSVAAAVVIAAGALALAYGGHRDYNVYLERFIQMGSIPTDVQLPPHYFPVSVEWLRLGNFSLSLGFKFDDLAALMLCIVGVVGLCVHVFSLGYMKDDAAKARYFGGLSIFMFSMIGIVLADNLFMIFIFWELVGFSSWLLINHWHEKQSAANASKKAFIVNRVGDFGFLLGIVMCYWLNGTVNLTAFSQHDIIGYVGSSIGTAAIPMFSDSQHHVFSTLIPLLLFCGAVGKSAQLPLQVWLPDAMEGPTPVSALIHAATMVAAGIYMLCRIEPLMVPDALTVIMWVGTATALYAALCAIVQRDIKKVLAYSTLSQLGYMVAAFGLGKHLSGVVISDPVIGPNGLPIGPMTGDPETLMYVTGVGAAMFHLTTHAFFKALLFLGSGAVIYGCHHEQDIFKMGGLRKKLPLTFVTFTIGVLAIIGMPGLAGFFSKDAILNLALEKNHAVFALLALTAVLTAFYMVRMWKLVFLGEPRSHEASHAHEGGLALTVPLIVLAALSVVGGYTGIYGGHFDRVFHQIPHAEGHTILIVSLAVMTLGAGAALFLYKSAPTDALEAKSPGLFGALTALKNSFDAAYTYYVAKIQQRFAMLLKFLEDILLAGVIIRGLAGAVGLVGLGARALFVGSLHAYVYWFLLGTVVLWAYAVGWFN